MTEPVMERDKKDFRQYLVEEADSTSKLREEMNKAFLGYTIDNIKERRDLYKQIALVSSGIMAFIPAMVDKVGNIFLPYVEIGAGLYFGVIFFIFAYFRETLDYDANEFQELGDFYNRISDDKEKVILDFIQRPVTDTIQAEYVDALMESDGHKMLKEHIAKTAKEKEEGKKNPSYISEIIVSFFAVATLFLFLSIIGPINVWLLIGIICLLLILTFSSFAKWIEKNGSKLLNILKRKLGFK